MCHDERSLNCIDTWFPVSLLTHVHASAWILGKTRQNKGVINLIVLRSRLSIKPHSPDFVMGSVCFFSFCPSPLLPVWQTKRDSSATNQHITLWVFGTREIEPDVSWCSRHFGPFQIPFCQQIERKSCHDFIIMTALSEPFVAELYPWTNMIPVRTSLHWTVFLPPVRCEAWAHHPVADEHMRAKMHQHMRYQFLVVTANNHSNSWKLWKYTFGTGHHNVLNPALLCLNRGFLGPSSAPEPPPWVLASPVVTAQRFPPQSEFHRVQCLFNRSVNSFTTTNSAPSSLDDTTTFLELLGVRRRASLKNQTRFFDHRVNRQNYCGMPWDITLKLLTHESNAHGKRMSAKEGSVGYSRSCELKQVVVRPIKRAMRFPRRKFNLSTNQMWEGSSFLAATALRQAGIISGKRQTAGKRVSLTEWDSRRTAS